MARRVELGLPVTTHLPESAAEAEWLRHRRGQLRRSRWTSTPSPPSRLADEGLLSSRVVAAHCVMVDEEEIALLAEHDVAVAHCPRSNAYLGCGIAPLAELRAAGLRVGLGTDSPASTPSFDMFEELRAAVSFARLRAALRERARRPRGARARYPRRAPARSASTRRSGSLAPGKRADLAVVSLEGTPYDPWEDPAAAVVFGGAPERVLLTVVDGEERYRKERPSGTG